MVLGEEQKRLGTTTAVQCHNQQHRMDTLVSAPRGPPAAGPATSVPEGGAGVGQGARTETAREKVDGKEQGREESG